MSVGRQYVLDANVFIEAHQKYYDYDICPGFWGALVGQHKAKRICSIDKVKQELVKVKTKGDNTDGVEEDWLSRWAQEQVPDTFFKGTADRRVCDAFRYMVNWVQNEPQFTSGAKAEFSSVADGWIVAFAKANGGVVVTHEEYAPEVKKKVPVPNVCIEFDVQYCNTFDMLKELKEKFVLRTRRRTK